VAVYRCVVADSLAPEILTPLLRGSFGRPYVYRETCDSTQLLLDESLPEGAVAACDEQTAGRGRLGRSWEAPPRTSILCSTLLRPPRGRRVAELSLVAGLAAAEAVEEALARPAGIKWPNDVLVDERKVAGVLAEGRGGMVVVGIGINVGQTTDELPPAAASLRTIDGRAHPRAPLLATLLERLELRYGSWLRDGLAQLRVEL
jgi:BirA family transcriptional regulator, biotin operon repressor / biotin---[acetyl-CoA-carboxylase] ligase